MSRKQQVAHDPTSDPTLPQLELKLSGKTYHPVFTFEALAIAELELKKVGHVVNIFTALDFNDLDATRLVALLYASLITETPEIQLADIPKMLTLRQIPDIKAALYTAFVLSMADPSEDSPTDPPQAE